MGKLTWMGWTNSLDGKEFSRAEILAGENLKPFYRASSPPPKKVLEKLGKVATKEGRKLK